MEGQEVVRDMMAVRDYNDLQYQGIQQGFLLAFDQLDCKLFQ